MLKLPPSSGSPIQAPSPFVSTALNHPAPLGQAEQPENLGQNQALAQGENLNVNEPEKGPLAEAPALQFAAAAPAETAKKKPTPQPNKPQPNKKNPPAPPLKKPAPPKSDPLSEAKPEAKPEPQPEPVDPDLGLDKPARIKGSNRPPEKADEQVYEEYLNLQREVRDDPSQSGLSPEARRSLIQDKLLLRLGREAYQNLPPAQQTALNQFLTQFEMKDLVVSEVQSEGGADAVDGIVTGTGVDGHYTNSLLNSLKGLLESKRLSPELLTALENFQQAPLHPELAPQRMTLLRSALQELAFPERIEQHSKGTCAPTTVQILLALKNPVKYLEILKGLASPEGKVPPAHLHNPDLMEREADTLKDDKSGRSLSSRLLQPAFMEYANGAENYDNTRDRNISGDKEYPGLDEKGAVRLNAALFGENAYQLRYLHADPDPTWKGFVKPSQLKQELAQVLAQGEPVPVGLRWGESAHKILLTAIDPEQEKAFFMNPWGELQHMHLEVFYARLESASLPQLPTKPPSENKATLETLPGKASQKSAYNAISNWRYYKVTDYLVEDPVLKKLPEAHKTLLREKFRSLRLSPEYGSRQLDLLLHLSKSGLADEHMFSRIQAVRDKDELAALVRLYGLSEKLAPEQLKPLLDAAPDQNLDAVYYEMLLNHLDQPEMSAILIAKAQAQKLAKETGQIEAQSSAQAKIKEDFIALESGGSLESLKVLSQDANEQTRLFMLRKIAEKWPYAQAEQAAQVLTADLNLMDLKYLLQGIEPNTRFVGADSPDQVRRYLRMSVRNAALTRKAAGT
jgi:hypothetical protein